MTEATKTKWRERVRAWKASGQTLVEFAKGREYSAGTLKWWAYKLNAEAKRSATSDRAPAAITLLPARRVRSVSRPKPTARVATGLVLEVGEIRVRVDYGFDRTLLREVLAALGGLP